MTRSTRILNLELCIQDSLVVSEYQLIIRNDINIVGTDIKCRSEKVGSVLFVVTWKLVLIYHDFN